MMGIKNFRRANALGFTIVEVLIVIVIIGILAGITYSTLTNSPDKARLTRANSELTTLANALNLYRAKNNVYPPDTSEAGLPSVINAYIADYNSSWPAGPWTGSLYDYEAWRVDTTNTPVGSIDTVQISLRFCTAAEAGGTGGAQLCASRAAATHQPWATSFNSNNNAYYYCVTGYCRSNQSAPLGTAGYCVNCPNNAAIAKPGGG